MKQKPFTDTRFGVDRASSSTSEMADQESLVCWRKHGRAEFLRPILERHTASVFSCAHKRLGNSDQAALVTRITFLVMARRRRKAAKLEHWLLKVALLASRKLKKRSFSWIREWFERKVSPKDLLPASNELVAGILGAIEATGRKRPREKLAKWALRKIFWQRWRRRGALLALLLVIAGAIAWKIEERRGYSGVIAQYIVWSSRFAVWQYAEETRPWTGGLQARNIASPADFYRTTNIWPVHLDFSRAGWNALSPRKIEPLPNFISDGQILLRNPKAPRSGLAGAMGYAFDWSRADLELGGPFPIDCHLDTVQASDNHRTRNG